MRSVIRNSVGILDVDLACRFLLACPKLSTLGQVRLEGNREKTGRFMAALSNHNGLEALSLDEPVFSEAINLQHFPSSLKILHIDSWEDMENAGMISDIGKRCPQLESISLDCNTFDVLSGILSSTKGSLKSLKIVSERNIFDQLLNISLCSLVQKVDMSDVYWSSENLSGPIFKAILDLPNLCELSLRLAGEDIERFMSILDVKRREGSVMRRLRRLDIAEYELHNWKRTLSEGEAVCMTGIMPNLQFLTLPSRGYEEEEEEEMPMMSLSSKGLLQVLMLCSNMRQVVLDSQGIKWEFDLNIDSDTVRKKSINGTFEVCVDLEDEQVSFAMEARQLAPDLQLIRCNRKDLQFSDVEDAPPFDALSLD